MEVIDQQMKKKIVYTVLILILGFGGYIYYRVSKPRPGLSNVPPAVNITATELYRKYEANETTADSLFLDKVIEVTGTIADVESTDSTLSLELKGGESGGVNCSIAGGNKTNAFKAGDAITLKGRCSGFLMDVTLTDCVIKDKH
jgi:putative nucleic acid binding protein